jgi:hypothetical protein
MCTYILGKVWGGMNISYAKQLEHACIYANALQLCVECINIYILPRKGGPSLNTSFINESTTICSTVYVYHESSGYCTYLEKGVATRSPSCGRYTFPGLIV